jgi:hypothetical protein
VASDAPASGAENTTKPSVRARAARSRPMRPNVTARGDPYWGNRDHSR